LLDSFFFKVPNVLPFQSAYVQNTIAFLPSVFGSRSKNSVVSFAGLKPSTGVPTTSKSKSSTTVGLEDDISKTGAFNASAMASPILLVFPVREKHNTQGFMIQNTLLSSNIGFA
jgi:hypothetical protein